MRGMAVRAPDALNRLVSRCFFGIRLAGRKGRDHGFCDFGQGVVADAGGGFEFFESVHPVDAEFFHEKRNGEIDDFYQLDFVGKSCDLHFCG